MVYLLVLAAVILLGFPPPSSQELTALDCSEQGSGSVNLSEILPSCEAITESETIWADIIERPPPLSVLAYRCLVTFSESPESTTGETVAIGRDACLEAHEIGRLVLRGYEIPHLDTNGTTEWTLSIPEDVDEHDDSEENTPGFHHYRITLSIESGTVDYYNDIVRFSHVACDFSELSCYGDGELFWSNPGGGSRTTLYRGEVVLLTKSESQTAPETIYALFYHPEKVFVLKTLGNQTVGETNELRTEVDDVYIIPNVGPKILIGVKSKFLGFDPSFDKKWKNVYLEKVGFEKDSAVDVVRRMCEWERKRFLRLPLSDLPRRGFLAKSPVGAGFIIVKKCATTKVHLRKTVECFDDIPVRDEGNNNLFLKADSRILVKYAEIVDCQAHEDKTNRRIVDNFRPTLSENLSQLTNRSDNKYWVLTAFIGAVLALVLTIGLLCLFMRYCYCRIPCSKQGLFPGSIPIPHCDQCNCEIGSCRCKNHSCRMQRLFPGSIPLHHSDQCNCKIGSCRCNNHSCLYHPV